MWSLWNKRCYRYLTSYLCLSLSVTVCLPSPVSLFLTCAHAVISSSLSVPPAISLCCTSSALHQIEADSCHQAYFRHWHTHNLHHSSLPTLSLCVCHLSLNFSHLAVWLRLPAWECVCVCVCVSKLDRFLRLGPYSTGSGGRLKQRGNRSSASSRLPCLFLSIWSPTPGRGFLTVFLPSVSLFQHISLIHL